MLGRSDVALMHFQQLYPLPENLGERLEQAQRIVVVEGNNRGQFARLLKSEIGREPDYVLGYYSGLQFSVEQIARDLDSCFIGRCCRDTRQSLDLRRLLICHGVPDVGDFLILMLKDSFYKVADGTCRMWLSLLEWTSGKDSSFL